MRTLAVCLVLLVASAFAGGVIDYGTNDVYNTYSYVGVLYTPDASAVSSCSGGYTYGYWNCPVTLVDHAQLGLDSSYAGRVVLTTEYCADIVESVPGKNYLVSFDYNPDASGALTMAGANCPNNNFRVIDIDTSKANFVGATMLKYMNDDFKYPSGLANGIQASGDWAVLVLDHSLFTASLPKAVIATSASSGNSLKKASGLTAAHNAASTVAGKDAWIYSPQRRYGSAAVTTVTKTALLVSTNPNQGNQVMTMSGAPLLDPATVSTTSPVILGLLSGSANANTMISYERVDTADAWAFFDSVAGSVSVAGLGASGNVKAAWHSSATTTTLLTWIVVGVWVFGGIAAIALIIIVVLKFMKRDSKQPKRY